MTLNELFAIQEADVTKEFLLKAGWSEIAEEPAEIFRRSRLVPDRVESHKEYKTINEQIQNIAQKKDTLCRRMYN